MSYTQDMAAWQREWMERYEPDPEVGYPLNDITPWWETGELVYAWVTPGAPPRPRLDRNPAIEEVKPEKAKLRVTVSIFGRPTPVELDVTQVERVG